jgi:hypothetical protein
MFFFVPLWRLSFGRGLLLCYMLQKLFTKMLLALVCFQLSFLISFLNSDSWGWSPNWVHSARWPFTGVLYLTREIVRMENLV